MKMKVIQPNHDAPPFFLFFLNEFVEISVVNFGEREGKTYENCRKNIKKCNYFFSPIYVMYIFKYFHSLNNMN